MKIKTGARILALSALNHNLIGVGFAQDRLQAMTHFRFITYQRHTQRLLHAILLRR